MAKRRSKIRILATSFDYRPRLGGIATLSYELVKAMAAREDVTLKVLAPAMEGSEKFDTLLGIETLRVPLPKTARNALVPLSAAIARETLAWSPDVILNFHWMPDASASLLSMPARTFRGVPYFVFAHAVEIVESQASTWKKFRSRFAPVKRAVFGAARGVFAVSGFTRKLLIEECRVSEEKIHTAHPGIDPNQFLPAPPARDLIEKYRLQGRRVFTTVCRMESFKGMDRVISALRIVKEKYPEVLYLVCGTGPDLPRLQALAQHYRVQEHVLFAGNIPAERLSDHYNLGEAFVMVSREDWETPNVEGFGIVFLEAAGCAKPSIGGRSGGIPDAVGGAEFGWLVDPTDDEAIAQAMLEVLDNPEEARRRGEAARKRALERFTWTVMAESVISVLKKEGRDVRD